MFSMVASSPASYGHIIKIRSKPITLVVPIQNILARISRVLRAVMVGDIVVCPIEFLQEEFLKVGENCDLLLPVHIFKPMAGKLRSII
jgi:hypothetical protein